MYAIALIILLIIILIWVTSAEAFAPYASILVPVTMNTSAGFDFPDQFGEITNPYAVTKVASENKAFAQTHALYGGPQCMTCGQFN